jgi:hypothetical protein
LKLAWPDKYDGRRKQKKYHAVPKGSAADYVTQDGTFAFLNTTCDDLNGEKVQLLNLASNEDDEAEVISLLPALPSIHGVDSQESLLLSYCEHVRIHRNHYTNRN